MTTRTIMKLIGGGALVMATASVVGAQEATPDPASQQGRTQTQAQKGDGSGEVRGAQNQTSPARQLGPGDGTGNQGVKLQDGTGYGSPGQMAAGSKSQQAEAAGSANSKTLQKAAKKAAKKANRTAAENAGNGVGGNGQGTGSGTRSRARDLSGLGSGSCTGTGSGSQRRGGGSGSRARQ